MSDQTYRLYLRQGEFELDVEGDRDFVQSYVAQILLSDLPMAAEGVKKPAHRLSAKQKAAKQVKPAAPAKQAASEPEGDVDAVALKAFMKGKKVHSDRERYLFYMGFLKSQGVTAVSDKTIHKCYAADGIKAPDTGRQNFSIMRNSKLTEPAKERGFWKLTPEGEKLAMGAAKAAAPVKTAGAKRVARKKAAAPKARSKGKKKTKR